MPAPVPFSKFAAPRQGHARTGGDTKNNYTAPLAVGCLQLRRLNILVAEDVPSNQMLTTAMLEKLGQNVEMASNGEDAVLALRTNPFDLVFMDLQMPVLDGCSAITQIRAMGGRAAATPIIAVSAFLEPASLRTAGIDAFLEKPFKFAELAAVVTRFAVETPAPPPDNPGLLIDTELLELMYATLGETSFRCVMAHFLENIPSACELLKNAADEESRDKVFNTAHQLAGMFGQFGGIECALLAVEIMLGRHSDFVAAARSLLQMSRKTNTEVGQFLLRRWALCVSP